LVFDFWIFPSRLAFSFLSRPQNFGKSGLPRGPGQGMVHALLQLK
jgi:hypothetical protein